MGHDVIYQQQQKWIDIYNRAHARMMSPDDADFRNTGLEALAAMEEYGRYHFAYEEAYQEEIGYPGLEAHHHIHETFMKQLDQIRLDLHQGRHILNSEIIKTIENRFKEHILVEDQKFRAFSAEEG